MTVRLPDEAWACEQHPDQPWFEHLEETDCAGPGMLTPEWQQKMDAVAALNLRRQGFS